MSQSFLSYFCIVQGDFVKKIIPNSIIKLLGLSCCSWMAWTSIEAKVVEKKIGPDSMVHVFESINKSRKKDSFAVVFDDSFVDPSGENDGFTKSKIIIQKPLTFDASDKTITIDKFPGTYQEIFKIEMPHRTDLCIFRNVNSIEGGVTIAKGVFSIPVGVVKGSIVNSGQLVLRAEDGQVIRESIKGSGTVTIQGTGIITLDAIPAEGGIIFNGEENKIASLIVTTESAPRKYLANVREGDWSVFNQDFDGNYAGTLLGKGGLAKTGEGTLTLTGDSKDRNSLTRIFSGEISINKPENIGAHAPISFKGGSLHITDSLELENPLIGSVRLIVDKSKVAEVLGSIGNERIKETSLIIEGNGTVLIKGSNTYAGATIVSNATLQIESDDSLGTGEDLILAHATLKAAPDAGHRLDINRNIVINESGTIYTDARTVNLFKDIDSINPMAKYVSALLLKEGPGKLAIHGNIKNSNLFVKEGFVHISSRNGIPEEHIFSGIKDPQEIFKKIDELKESRGFAASPMVFLNGVNVNAGADLAIFRNLVHMDSLYGSGDIQLRADTAYLVIESGDFAGAMSSSREHDPKIIKMSQKELKLHGNNSRLFGDILIREGKVLANSTIASDVFVFEDGHLTGNAYVRGLWNQGSVRPGNSIGMIQVGKDFVQGPSGRLEIEVNAQGESDLVQVGGKASLDGSLCIIPEPGIYRANTDYTILQAEKVQGTFQNIENTASDTLVFDIRYEPDEVIASVTKTMYQLPKYDEMSENSKNLNAFMQEAQFKEGTALFNIVENIFTLKDQKDLEDAYSQIAPIQLGGMAHESYINTRIVADSFTNVLHRNDRCINSTSTIWINPIGQYAYQKHGYGIGGYKSSMRGVVMGGNHFVHENIVIGAGIGFTSSCLKWGKGKQARSHITSFYAGLNGGWKGDLFYANASIITSGNTFKNQRHLQLANIHYTIGSEYYGTGLTSCIEAGCNFAVAKNIRLRPFVGLDMYTVFERPVNERETSPIHFHRGSIISHELRSKAALEATGKFTCSSICFSPGLLLGWIAQTPLRSTDYKVSLNDTGKQLVVKGFERNRINQGIAVGANVIAGYKTTSISLSYEFDFGKNCGFIHQASISADWKF